jgi:hypothetical protein
MNEKASLTVASSRKVYFSAKVLEDVMTRVPFEYSTPAKKAHFAECILKVAAQGQTSYGELVSSAADQIQTVLSLFA